MGVVSKVTAVISAVIAIAGVVIVLSFLMLKLLWAWVIPDLFPGAVSQGLIVAEISWWTSFKLAIFLGVMGGFLKGIKIGKS